MHREQSRGAEEILEMGPGLHEVEEISEGLWLAKVELTLIRPVVIVHFEHNEEIQHDGFMALVERRACIAEWDLDDWEGIAIVVVFVGCRPSPSSLSACHHRHHHWVHAVIIV